MSFDWRAATKAERAARIVEVYKPGMSAHDVAMAVPAPSRNAVLGLYHRWGARLMPGVKFLRAVPSEDTVRRRQRVKGSTRSTAQHVISANVALARERALMGDPTPEKRLHNHKPPVVEGLATLDLPLTELGRHDCRWVTQYEGYLMCGLPAKDGSSYCPAHHRIVYVPAEKRARAA